MNVTVRCSACDTFTTDAIPTPVPGLVMVSRHEHDLHMPDFSVIHVRSGCSVVAHDSPEELARVVLNILQPLDWTRPAAEIQTDPDVRRCMADLGDYVYGPRAEGDRMQDVGLS